MPPGARADRCGTASRRSPRNASSRRATSPSRSRRAAPASAAPPRPRRRAALRCRSGRGWRRGARRRRGGRRLFLRRGRAAAPEPGLERRHAVATDDGPRLRGRADVLPDGQTLAYVADRDGNFEIYLQQISGGPAINLTHNAAADIQPAFSPDGREIAFVSTRSSSSELIHAAPGLPMVGGDIWMMPALGGMPRRIVENGNCPRGPPTARP